MRQSGIQAGQGREDQSIENEMGRIVPKQKRPGKAPWPLLCYAVFWYSDNRRFHSSAACGDSLVSSADRKDCRIDVISLFVAMICCLKICPFMSLIQKIESNFPVPVVVIHIHALDFL